MIKVATLFPELLYACRLVLDLLLFYFVLNKYSKYRYKHIFLSSVNVERYLEHYLPVLTVAGEKAFQTMVSQMFVAMKREIPDPRPYPKIKKNIQF